MKLKVITPKGTLSFVEVEEKPKTYKILNQNNTGICRCFISKAMINVVYDDGYSKFLAYTVSDEEAKNMWNTHIVSCIERLDEKYKKSHDSLIDLMI